MLRDDRTDGLVEEDYRRLAAIARREPSSQHLDEQMLRFLGRRCALRYMDSKGQQWLDVHPLLIETEGFRRAYDLIA